jgi:hypothetical protein
MEDEGIVRERYMRERYMIAWKSLNAMTGQFYIGGNKSAYGESSHSNPA